jgi:hypothetical protein
METKEGEVKEEKPVKHFEPIPLLSLVMAAENQNGLRHKDYQRYQNYCSRKLRK